MSLTFDPGPHEYRFNGAVVPSVTQLIKPYSDDRMRFVDPDKLALARDKGIANHRMVELHFLKRLARVPQWQEGVMDALLKFIDEQRFVFVSSEQRLHHPSMGYAGTYDLTGYIKGRYGVVDVKRSLIGGRTIGLQLSGYKRLIEAQNGLVGMKCGHKWALCLNEDGTYQLTEFTDPRDDAAFLAAVTLWKWQHQGI